MKRLSSLQILHRYRDHLLQEEQLNLQSRLAEEREQESRLRRTQEQIVHLHQAKLSALSVGQFRQCDQGTTLLQARKLQEQRTLNLLQRNRAEALQKTLKSKKSRDQVETLLTRAGEEAERSSQARERLQQDEIASQRYLAKFKENP